MTESKSIMVVEFKSEDVEASGIFKGYGSTFGNIDLGGDVCEKGCFDRTLKEHMKAGTMPAMFWSHDSREPIGEWDEMDVDGKGLKLKGRLWIGKGIVKAEQAYLQMKSKGPKGLSIGYITRDSSRDEKTGVRKLKDLDLLEISPTPFPMNPKATVTAVKALLAAEDDTLSPRKAEEILRDVGFSGSDAKTFISKLGAWYKQRDAADDLATRIKNLSNILKG